MRYYWSMEIDSEAGRECGSHTENLTVPMFAVPLFGAISLRNLAFPDSMVMSVFMLVFRALLLFGFIVLTGYLMSMFVTSRRFLLIATVALLAFIPIFEIANMLIGLAVGTTVIFGDLQPFNTWMGTYDRGFFSAPLFYGLGAYLGLRYPRYLAGRSRVIFACFAALSLVGFLYLLSPLFALFFGFSMYLIRLIM